MNKEKIKELVKRYEKACNDILRAFSETYDVYVDSEDWVAGQVGTTVCVNEEYYLNMEDLLLMLNNGVGFDEFLRWWDYSLECSMLELPSPNLRSWLKGCPTYTHEELDKIKEKQEEVRKSEEGLKRLIEETKNKF